MAWAAKISRAASVVLTLLSTAPSSAWSQAAPRPPAASAPELPPAPGSVPAAAADSALIPPSRDVSVNDPLSVEIAAPPDRAADAAASPPGPPDEAAAVNSGASGLAPLEAAPAPEPGSAAATASVVAPASVAVEAPDVAASAHDRAPDRGAAAHESSSKLPSYLLWSASGLTLVFGAYFGVSALDAKHAFDTHPSASRADRAEHQAMIADIAIGLGISFAVIGTFLYFTEDALDDERAGASLSKRASQHALLVAPMLQPRAGGVSAALQF